MRTGWVALALGTLFGCARLNCATFYYDVVIDGVDVDLADYEFFGEGSPPSKTRCDAGVEIVSTFDGETLTASATYPAIAETRQQAPAYDPVDHTWDREALVPVPNGSGCYFDVLTWDWVISIRQTYFGPPPTVNRIQWPRKLQVR
jgi:hypothetical protein